MDIHCFLHIDFLELRAIQKLDELHAQVTHMTNELSTKIDALQGTIDAMGARITSNTTLLQGLSAIIAGMTTTDPVLLAKLDSMKTQIDAELAALTAADVANTPA